MLHLRLPLEEYLGRAAAFGCMHICVLKCGLFVLTVVATAADVTVMLCKESVEVVTLCHKIDQASKLKKALEAELNDG